MTKTFRFILLFGMLLVANTVSAQRLQVVDNDGDGIAYASVMTQDAQFIGITDFDGYLADTKGADISGFRKGTFDDLLRYLDELL